MYRKYNEGKSSSMTLERIKVLDEVGFIWSGTMPMPMTVSIKGRNDDNNHKFHVENQLTAQDQAWMNHYNKLKEYWHLNDKSYKNLKVSPQYSSLSSWIVRQRRENQNFKLGEKSTMTKDRIELLDRIDFDWSPRDTNWNIRIQELIEYKTLYGDCLVRK